MSSHMPAELKNAGSHSQDQRELSGVVLELSNLEQQLLYDDDSIPSLVHKTTGSYH